MSYRSAIAAAVLLVLDAAAASAQVDGTAAIRAQLSPRRYTTLSGEIAAKIDRLIVREGDRVKDGQTLVAMDCSLQRASLEKARAAQLAAEKTKAVNKRLHEMNAGGALEAEVAAVEAAKAAAEVQAGQAVVAKCTVTAPFAGRIAELKVREQQFVQPGTPMVEVIDDSVLEVEFLAPSRWLTWLKPGAVFKIAVDETERTYPARIARLGARVDPVSQTVKVIGEITGGQSELMAGMSGRILVTAPD